MDDALDAMVRRRAGDGCEYCQLPQEYSSTRLEIEHIIPEQHRGQTVASNLALACFADNRHKGPNLGGIDPKTGKKVWLYNPRRHKWSRHFRWDGPTFTAAPRSAVQPLPFSALIFRTEWPNGPR